MTQDIVMERLVNLVCQRFARPLDTLGEQTWDEPLTGYMHGFLALDMVYLLFEVEKEFGVRIGEEYLAEYRFNTLNAIAAAVLACSEKNKDL